jgi:hypothetical protein
MIQINWVAVQAVVGAFTFLALLLYAWETRKLRLETQRQARLSSLPVASVEFRRGPDQIFMRNSGPAIVGKAVLQGFRFRGGDGSIWRCTFTPVTMISLGVSAPTFYFIAIEGYVGAPLLGGNGLFDIVLSDALKGRQSIRLALYATDVFGSCYRSEVEITGDFWWWKDHGEIAQRPMKDWQLPMLPLRQVSKMPKEVPLEDFTSPGASQEEDAAPVQS